ncbi:MAG: hypothetical protein JWR72_3695 [Flavisolibacter sp.]|nr:hypothetical protein [Flavisolibacter sp.]
MLTTFNLVAISMWCWLLPLLPHTISKKASFAPIASVPSPGLFDVEDVLEIKLSGNIRALFNNRASDAGYYPLLLTYKETNRDVSIPLKAKTRGNFRRDRDNCLYPPILLNFQKASNKKTLFQEQDKLKLVMPCQGDQYVIKEYLVYKLYNLITPKSYRTRLAKVSFYDSVKKKEVGNFFSFLIEEDGQMAKRNETHILEKKMIRGESTETETFLKMAVFQYMIGNTDWSVPYLHNIRILAFDSSTIPSVVPYDFDHAGIVDAPYALPPEQLGLRSTQDRRFRGYCITDMKTFDQVVAVFNRLRKDIYNVYTSCPLIDSRYVAATTKFLDGFYDTINDPKKSKAAFSYPCQKGMQVVIKGLDN